MKTKPKKTLKAFWQGDKAYVEFDTPKIRTRAELRMALASIGSDAGCNDGRRYCGIMLTAREASYLAGLICCEMYAYRDWYQRDWPDMAMRKKGKR